MLNVNAVAPDWNLKLFDEMMEKLTNEECSRTRLEFKDTDGVLVKMRRYNAVAPDWNLKLAREQCNGCPYR